MEIITGSRDFEAYLRPRIRLDVEEVWAVALSSRLEIIAGDLIFRGHASSCVIHPREIFRFAIEHGAVSLALAHSHPSGDAEPSAEDLEVTRRLFDVGQLIGIPLIEHVILGAKEFVSLADRGHFRKWSLPSRNSGRSRTRKLN